MTPDTASWKRTRRGFIEELQTEKFTQPPEGKVNGCSPINKLLHLYDQLGINAGVIIVSSFIPDLFCNLMMVQPFSVSFKCA